MKSKNFIIIFIILILLIPLIINKTFLRSNYKNNSLNIPIPSFSYFKSENKENNTYTIKFKSLKNHNKINNELSNYIENLTSCYDENYFYDKNSNITITKYNIKNKFLINEFSISYYLGNYCENEYVLETNWNLKLPNNFNEIFIEKCSTNQNDTKCDKKIITTEKIKAIFNLINENNRINTKDNINLNNNNDYYLISAYYSDVLLIFNHNNNLAFQIIDSNDHKKNALYSINNNVNNLLENIYKD